MLKWRNKRSVFIDGCLLLCCFTRITQGFKERPGKHWIKESRGRDFSATNQLVKDVFKNFPHFEERFFAYNGSDAGVKRAHKQGRAMALETTRDRLYQVMTTENTDDTVLGQHTTIYTCNRVKRYLGNPLYTEYREGDMLSKIIIVAPHDGHLKPSSIPKRDAGCLVNHKCIYDHDCVDRAKGFEKNFDKCSVLGFTEDLYTQHIAERMGEELEYLTGHRPHMVINHLHRSRLDVNRPIDMAAFNVPEAELAWKSFHRLLNIAKDNMDGRRAIIFDLHENSFNAHRLQIMFGYNIKDMNSKPLSENISTSIDNLRRHTNLTLEQLVRGKYSLGSTLERRGYTVIPAPNIPHDKDFVFLTGGHISRHFGSSEKVHGGRIDAVQIEVHAELAKRSNFTVVAQDLAKTVHKFVKRFY